jgi:two-component system nitrate/nitrite sensor histidine kinase NarX
MAQPIRGPWGTYGELWVARRRDLPYDRLDHRFLESMAELVSVAITNARMREHEERNAVLAERERIAREMHDGMAQVLGVTHLRLRALEASPELADARAGAEITELAELCQEAYRDVREGILGLHESSQPERALLDSLREYAAKFERHTGITTTVVSRLSREPELSPRCELQVVRVVQEALTNVRKHADAHNVVVWVAQSVDGTTFVIEDDGRGFDVAGVNADSDGFGLRSMRERMELLEGSLVVDSAPGSGTRVVATVRGPVFTPSSEVDHVDG